MRPLTRREFLYYLWATSIALFTTEVAGVGLQMVRPRYKLVGECFNFCYTFDPKQVPMPDSPPRKITYPDGPNFWLVNVGPQMANDSRHPAGMRVQTGLLALYAICPHLGCHYEWGAAAELFICPCDGSAFLADGTRVHGPAARDLDVFPVTIMDKQGMFVAETKPGQPNDLKAAQPISLSENAHLIGIGIRYRILGHNRTGPNAFE